MIIIIIIIIVVVVVIVIIIVVVVVIVDELSKCLGRYFNFEMDNKAYKEKLQPFLSDMLRNIYSLSVLPKINCSFTSVIYFQNFPCISRSQSS